MPVIAIHIDDKLYAQLTGLLSNGAYSELQQVIEVALRNQLVMEAQVRQAGGRPVQIPGNGSQPKERSTKIAARAPETKQSTKNSGQHAKSAPTEVVLKSPTTNDWADIISSFRYGDKPTKGPDPCSATRRPADERMYALINRLFPLKLSVRWIDVRAGTLGHWPSLEDVIEALSNDVAAVGAVLAEADTVSERQRDEQFATALPRPDRLESRERFATQFLARINQAGDVRPGAIMQMALAVVRNGQLVLTGEGQELARLSNPIVDLKGLEADEVLTADERKVFVDQIQRYTPAEFADSRDIMKALSNGSIGPEELLRRLHGKFPSRESDAAFRSHVSGIIARCVDMGLIRRTWEGRNVIYSATAEGAALRIGEETTA
jgi:hypothetical protein